MKNLCMLFITMPLLILGTTLSLLIHNEDSKASMIIIPGENASIAFPIAASEKKFYRQQAADGPENGQMSQVPGSIRQELVSRTLEKLPLSEPIQVKRKTLQTTAVLLFGFGIFGVSSFLRNIFRIR